MPKIHIRQLVMFQEAFLKEAMPQRNIQNQAVLWKASQKEPVPRMPIEVRKISQGDSRKISFLQRGITEEAAGKGKMQQQEKRLRQVLVPLNHIDRKLVPQRGTGRKSLPRKGMSKRILSRAVLQKGVWRKTIYHGHPPKKDIQKETLARVNI